MGCSDPWFQVAWLFRGPGSTEIRTGARPVFLEDAGGCVFVSSTDVGDGDDPPRRFPSKALYWDAAISGNNYYRRYTRPW